MGFHVLWTKTSGKSALHVTHSRTDMQGLYLPQETAIMGRSPCCHRACIQLGKTDNKEVKAANSWEVPRRKINPDKEQKTGMFCEAGGAGEEEGLRRAKCRGWSSVLRERRVRPSMPTTQDHRSPVWGGGRPRSPQQTIAHLLMDL